MNQKTLRWGIAGLGNISHRFAEAISSQCQIGILTGVAARDEKRAVLYAKQYGVPRVFDCYQSMAESDEIDAVYIATVHPFHKPLAKLFLEHGKHVLVEKPAFTNLADWLEMKALAISNNCLLLEAMKTVTYPAYQQLKQYLRENRVELTEMRAHFGYQMDYDPECFVFNPELSGGATLDVGVYGLWLYCDLCDWQNQVRVHPSVKMDRSVPNVDIDTNTSFIFGGAIKGDIRGAITEKMAHTATLKGTLPLANGKRETVVISIGHTWWNPELITIQSDSIHKVIEIEAQGNGFEFQIDHFSEYALAGKLDSEVLSHKTTEAVLAIMDDGLNSNGFSHITLGR